MRSKLPDAFREYRDRVKRGELSPGELAAFRAGAEWGVNEAAEWLASPQGRGFASEPDWMFKVRRTVSGRIKNWARGLLDW